MIGAYTGPLMLPIAPYSEIKACAWTIGGKTFISVSGPCGEHHTMSVAEAENLRKWLGENLPLPSSARDPHKRYEPPQGWPDIS